MVGVIILKSELLLRRTLAKGCTRGRAAAFRLVLVILRPFQRIDILPLEIV